MRQKNQDPQRSKVALLVTPFPPVPVQSGEVFSLVSLLTTVSNGQNLFQKGVPGSLPRKISETEPYKFINRLLLFTV